MSIYEGDKVKIAPGSLIKHDGQEGTVIAEKGGIGTHHIKVKFPGIGITDWMDKAHFVRVAEIKNENSDGESRPS